MASKTARPTSEGSAPIALVRAIWAWYMQVAGADRIRQQLNRGLLLVLAAMLILLLFALPIWLASGMTPPAIFSALATLPTLLVAALLTRRGSAAGGVLLAVFLCVVNAVSFYPESYVSPPTVHVNFVLAAAIAAIFVRPSDGFCAGLLQVSCLCVALTLSGVPRAAIVEFAIAATLNIFIITAVIAVGASIFRRSIADLAALNHNLDGQVAERTAELRRVMELRERDISAVVHDIGNRLLVVRGEVDELLLEAGGLGVAADSLRQSEARIDGALTSMGYLVGDLRTAIQLDNAVLRLRPQSVAIGDLLGRAVDAFSLQAAHAGCELRLSLAPGLPIIEADGVKLDRVFANLIGNALKYTRQMPPGQRRVVVEARPAEGGVEVLVADSGPGLDADSLARLGQPFTRLTSAEGTDGMGLGIYISRGIVELHRGRISFGSAGPGRGLTVVIWLPA